MVSSSSVTVRQQNANSPTLDFQITARLSPIFTGDDQIEQTISRLDPW